jgi:hypothetical protein
MQATQLSAHFMELHLTTSAGTYVKEFVHGDLGRTVPSIGSLLQCTADILQLDVMGVEDQWSKGTTATNSITAAAATAAAAASAAASAAADSSYRVCDTTTNTAEAAPTTADADAQTKRLVTNGQHAGDAVGSTAAAGVDLAEAAT